MDFTSWLASNGYDAEKLTTNQRKHLEAAWKAETAPPPETPKKEAASSFDETLEAIEKENQRVEYIREATLKACQANIGNSEKCKQLRELSVAAIADKKMDTRDFDLAILRVDRMLPTMVMSPQSNKPASADVIEAAICSSQKLPGIEERFSAHVLEAAHKDFKHGLGLRDFLCMAAERNSGYRGSPRDLNAVFRAALRNPDEMMATGWGPSTISVPGILSSVANKFLFVGFNAIDTSWREIAATRSVNDYKQYTTYGLTGDLEYVELPPSGEIKHGTLGETSYTNQVSIFARMLGIDERDIRNDDLSALSSASVRLGRGAALALNTKFWSTFLNNSSFFSAGNNNVITGASSVLSGGTGLGALALADEKFRLQTDPDGKPLGTMPRILLVPTALRVSGMNLMNSTTVVSTTTANAPLPDQNVFAGAYRVVSSPYLQNSAFTGYSSTAWYLLADPGDMPVIEVAFLDGQDTPSIETADAEFTMLGIAMRGVLKFGVALMEYRGGVRAAGA